MDDRFKGPPPPVPLSPLGLHQSSPHRTMGRPANGDSCVIALATATQKKKKSTYTVPRPSGLNTMECPAFSVPPPITYIFIIMTNQKLFSVLIESQFKLNDVHLTCHHLLYF